MTLKIIFECDAQEHVWVSFVPEIGNISTYGDTLEEVVAHTREAVVGYLEAAAEHRLPVPHPGLIHTALGQPHR